MIAIAAIGFSLLLVPLVGGRLKRLKEVHLDSEGAIVALFIVQAAARAMAARHEEYAPVALIVWAVACLALIAFLLRNAAVSGVGVLILGLGLNLLVVLLNGAMPYALPRGSVVSVHSGFYRVGARGTVAGFLGDVLPDPTGTLLLSLGDMLLAMGVIAFVLGAATGIDWTPAAVRED